MKTFALIHNVSRQPHICVQLDKKDLRYTNINHNYNIPVSELDWSDDWNKRLNIPWNFNEEICRVLTKYLGIFETTFKAYVIEYHANGDIVVRPEIEK